MPDKKYLLLKCLCVVTLDFPLQIRYTKYG